MIGIVRTLIATKEARARWHKQATAIHARFHNPRTELTPDQEAALNMANAVLRLLDTLEEVEGVIAPSETDAEAHPDPTPSPKPQPAAVVHYLYRSGKGVDRDYYACNADPHRGCSTTKTSMVTCPDCLETLHMEDWEPK